MAMTLKADTPAAERPSGDASAARPRDPDLPDPSLFWKWVGRATRPVVGWILTGIGVIVLLIGYLGVSRESLVAKQLPYFISGGVGGLILTIVGAYFLGTEELRKDSGRLDRLESMVHELHLALLARSDAPDLSPAAPSANGRHGATLVALPNGSTYHRPDCRMVDGKTEAAVLSNGALASRKLAPCSLCTPEPVE